MKAPTPLEALLKERVARAVGPEMRAIEEAIAAEIASPVHLIHEMGEFIAGAGGKRLRPILLLMAARMAGYNGPRAVRMGCVVELLHTATLIHDDVVDQAPLRRGRPSANARWGDDASILVGDHLYSKSFALMVADGDPDVLETLARATVSMTEAEVLQLECKREGAASEADYLRIITQKTASFISACCRIGGLLAKAPDPQVEALTRYGVRIGIAFQMSDDSLDFVADQGRLGKAVGADLKEGKRTLPLIAALDRATPAERDRVQSVLKRHAAEPGEIEEIRRLVERYGGVEYALGQAQEYARSAKQALTAFPDSPDKDTLLLVADYVVERDT
ncbi:MAG TPA: polyprenyl synthetase family protein [Terriglobales bacterium]|nr:polyprenyl synthetase family protein [Terriglobales bacterium]